MNLELVKFPTPSLLEPSIPITDFEYAKLLSTEMFKFTKDLWGKVVGLAAVQVGHNVNLFIDGDGKAYLNPEIVKASVNKNYYHEGCYSLEKDKFDYPVWRSQSIYVRYQTVDGEWRAEKLNGKSAQFFQHEFDHLQGRLCYEL